MKIVQDSPRRAYINVMELLVAEEVEQQVRELSPRIMKYLKVVEVETYALNRLPALYASSEKGWRHQYEKAKRELRNQIKSAVRQAIAAVQVDPLRSSEPLKLDHGDEASSVLESLRDMLKQPNLSWDSVMNQLRDFIATNRSGISPHAAEVGLEVSHRTRYRPMAGDRNPSSPNARLGSTTSGSTSSTATSNTSGSTSHGQYWRPGTYGASISWQRRRSQESSQDANPSSGGGGIDFDWNDSRYSQ